MRKTHLLSLVGLGLLLTSPALAQQAPAAPPETAASAPAEATPATAAPAAAPVEMAAAPEEVAAAETDAPAEVPDEPAPMPEAPAPEEPMATDTDMAENMAEPPVEAEEEGGVPGWFRVDSDGLGLQLWFGATHDLGGVGLATDIYVDSGTFAEFDIGIEIPIGDSLLIPMIGIGFNWAEMRPTTLIAPQLFAYLDFSPVYIEYWGQFFFNSPLASDDVALVDAGPVAISEKDAAADTFYNRLQLFFNVSETVQLGPQLEPILALNDAAGDGLVSLPIGLGTNIGYGENNTLGLFLGYETQEDARVQVSDFTGETVERGITGRFTFVKTW
jgi:hypothetical protein